MSTGGIKELVADVDVVAEDFRASAVNTAALRDQNVTAAKIASAAVTLTKINKEVGVWGAFAITTTAGTVTTAFRTILSSAVTLLGCIVDIKTAVTAASSLTISDTAGADLVVFPEASAIKTMSTQNMTALTTVLAIPIAAGGVVQGVLSNTSDKFKANVYLLTITTPT